MFTRTNNGGYGWRSTTIYIYYTYSVIFCISFVFLSILSIYISSIIVMGCNDVHHDTPRACGTRGTLMLLPCNISNDREYRFAHDVPTGAHDNEQALAADDDDEESRFAYDMPIEIGRDFRLVRVGPGVTTITADREIRFSVGARLFRHVSRKEFEDYLEGIRHLEHDEVLRYVDVMDYMERSMLHDSCPKVDFNRLSSRFGEYVFQVC